MNARDDSRVPLVVDVEGALVKTNLLHEKVMQFIARTPWQAWRLPLWLAQGGRTIRREIEARVTLDVNATVLRAETLARIKSAQAQGRSVYLVSAADSAFVGQLAEYLGGISGVFVASGSQPGGDQRVVQLNAALGPQCYDYIGVRAEDFPVWQSARRVIAVARKASFGQLVRRSFPDSDIVATPRLQPGSYLSALRPHQWAKNLLVFLPLAAGHRFETQAMLDTGLAFVCFCLAASSAYMFNDLLDLPGDRAHPRKRLRPFAAGILPISHGLASSIALMSAAFGISLALPLTFTAALALYVALTLGYSMVFKRKLLIDVIVLSGLYAVRVLGGIAAVGSEYSYWLLMFCLFLFLSLATVKRCSELVATSAAGRSAPAGRGYRHGDLAVLFPLGAAAGYGSVLIVALYLSSPEVVALYEHPLRLWLLCPLLLYWISRVLILASRNELHHDPVIFALSDRISLLTGIVAAGVVAAAI